MHVVLEDTQSGGKLWLGGIAAAGRVEILLENSIGVTLAAAGWPPVARDGRITHIGTFDGTGIVCNVFKPSVVMELLELVTGHIFNGDSVLVSGKNGAHRSATLAALVLLYATDAPLGDIADHLKDVRCIVDLSSNHPGARRRGKEPPPRPIDWLTRYGGRIRRERAERGLPAGRGEPLVLNRVMGPAKFSKWSCDLGLTLTPEYIAQHAEAGGRVEAAGRVEEPEAPQPKRTRTAVSPALAEALQIRILILCSALVYGTALLSFVQWSLSLVPWSSLCLPLHDWHNVMRFLQHCCRIVAFASKEHAP